MSFALTDDQRMISEGLRAFVTAELQPHEALVEKLDVVPDDLFREIQQKARWSGRQQPRDGGNGIRPH
jgi:acyl-CoA dehydrogenase